jgi:plasmid maintenance system antidote protein VapI
VIDFETRPGRIIHSLAARQGMTLSKLADRLMISRHDTTKLLNGNYPINKHLAERLDILFSHFDHNGCYVYGVDFWLDIEESYRKNLQIRGG